MAHVMVLVRWNGNSLGITGWGFAWLWAFLWVAIMSLFIRK